MVNMTNTRMLNDKIHQSGLKKQYIAEKIGVSRSTFYSQLKGEAEFKGSQIIALANLIGLTSAERNAIFFAESVAYEATEGGGA